jgi:hypothetical protein
MSTRLHGDTSQKTVIFSNRFHAHIFSGMTCNAVRMLRSSYDTLSRVTRREVAAISDVISTCITRSTDPEGDTSLHSRMGGPARRAG